MSAPESGHLERPIRNVVHSPIVHVVMPAQGEPSVARVYSKDWKVDTTVPVGGVAKRLAGATHGYFKAELFDDGILELGERVPAPEKAW